MYQPLLFKPGNICVYGFLNASDWPCSCVQHICLWLAMISASPSAYTGTHEVVWKQVSIGGYIRDLLIDICFQTLYLHCLSP